MTVSRASATSGTRRARPSDARCPVCAARDWREETSRLRCSHCGLCVPDVVGHARGHATWPALEDLLRPGDIDLAAAVPGHTPALFMDAYTLRTAASTHGLAFEPADAVQADALRRPHSPLAARGRLVRFAAEPPRVTLGMLLRAEEAPKALERLERWRDRFASVVFVIDAPGTGLPETSADGTLVLRHVLDGDFAAQRNRAQRAAPTPWVLQLDADETPDEGLLDSMDALVAQADRHALVSIGLPRRNFVDGTFSDLYPDVQYRLNRRESRYAGRVHERPDLGGEWWRSMIAPGAGLAHRLERVRVAERARRYEAIATGGARHGDSIALLRAFRP